MLRHLLLCLVIAAPLAVHADPAPARLTPAQLHEDLLFLQRAIAQTHPDPGLTSDVVQLDAAYARLAGSSSTSMTRDQAWLAFARLNRLFGDAHMQVLIPDWRAQATAHLNSGQRLFPFDVLVDAAGTLTIRSALDGSASALAGQRIGHIDGIPARHICAQLLSLTPGDTPALRAHLLSRRFWLTYWKRYGAPSQFRLVLDQPGKRNTVTVPGSDRLPRELQSATARFDSQFRFAMLPDRVALLTVKQFVADDKQAFYAFTRDAFTRMRAEGASTLLIDIRENTGGDDDMWKEGILPYIADKPFRNGSSYIKKVLAGRASGSERVGDVVHGTVDSWVQPQPDHPLRFRGKVVVLVGRLTYSSAVLFSNVMQDFGFGQLAGAGGYARARQSGGTQMRHLLPHSGLEITLPRFVLDRPSGKRDPALLQPDLVLPDDPLDPDALVRALLATLPRASPPAAALPASPPP